MLEKLFSAKLFHYFLKRLRPFGFETRIIMYPECGSYAHMTGIEYPLSGCLSHATSYILDDLDFWTKGFPKRATHEQIVKAILRYLANRKLAFKKKLKELGSNIIWSLSDSYENDLLKLEFLNQNITNYSGDSGAGSDFDLRGSVTAGNFYVSLHSSSPGESATEAQFNSTELSYSGYTKVSIPRSTSGWTVSNNTVQNAGEVTFATNNGSDQTAMFSALSNGLTGTKFRYYRYSALTVSNAQWIPFTSIDASDSLRISQTGVTFANDDYVAIAPAYDGSLPGGLQGMETLSKKVYKIANVNVSGSIITFTLKDYDTNTDVALSSEGCGVLIKAKPLVVRGGGTDQPRFVAGNIRIKVD